MLILDNSCLYCNVRIEHLQFGILKKQKKQMRMSVGVFLAESQNIPSFDQIL